MPNAEGIQAVTGERAPGQTRSPTLNKATIRLIVEGRHGDPFSVLGPHGDMLRVFLPSANAVAVVFMNTNAAAAGGLIAALLLAKLLFGKADLTMALNGALAGLVAITAEPSTPTPALVSKAYTMPKPCARPSPSLSDCVATKWACVPPA